MVVLPACASRAQNVIAWGSNTLGLSDVPSSATNVVSVAAGFYHSLALRLDGTVVGWGKNWDGQTNVPPDSHERGGGCCWRCPQPRVEG